MRATEFTNFNYKTEPYEGWNGNGMVVRAYDGKDEVGYVIFEPTEDDVSQWYAVDVEVEEPYQRKGIATKMYDIAKKAAKQQNVIIVKSHAQTNDGRGLWQDKNVWEQQTISDKSKDPIENAILDFYQHVGKIHKDPIDDYVSTAKEMLGHVSDPTLKSKLLDIFRQAKQNPYIQGGVVTTIGALLAGGVLSSAQKMGLSPSQTNLALQAILNTIIPTVVSRINGKSWSDTIKYTLASMGIGTGIAGMMEETK